MTRDEAIQTVLRFAPENSLANIPKFAAQHVDLCAALGMLTIDEPKNLETIIFDEFNSALGTMHYHRMKETLMRLNLKIVER